MGDGLNALSLSLSRPFEFGLLVLLLMAHLPFTVKESSTVELGLLLSSAAFLLPPPMRQHSYTRTIGLRMVNYKSGVSISEASTLMLSALPFCTFGVPTAEVSDSQGSAVNED